MFTDKKDLDFYEAELLSGKTISEIDRMSQDARHEGRGCREKKKKSKDSDTDDECSSVRFTGGFYLFIFLLY